MRRQLNRRFYRWLFGLYRAVFPTPEWRGAIDPRSLRRILVVQRHGVGDMVLTTPLLSFLRELAPTAEIVVLASRRNADVIAGHPAVTRVVVYGDGLLERVATIRQLRAQSYDAIFSGQAAKHMAEARVAAGIARRSTYKVSTWRPKRYQGLFTTVARLPPSATHTVERLLYLAHHAFDLTEALATTVRRHPLWIGTDPQADARVAEFLANRSVGRYIVVNVAAHFAVRDWLPAHCATVLRALLRKEPNLRAVVTRPPGKEGAAAEVVRLTDERDVLLAPQLSVLGVAALVRRAAAVVSVDTALVHIAAACGRPVVALFAPVVPADVDLWRPFGVRSRVLASPFGGRVSDIPVSDIVSAAAALVD